MAILETILPADFYVRLLPDAYAAGDFSALDAGAEPEVMTAVAPLQEQGNLALVRLNVSQEE